MKCAEVMDKNNVFGLGFFSDIYIFCMFLLLSLFHIL